MTKITTRTLSRYKSLFTVLLALLLLAIAAAPVSAALIPVYQAGSGASQNANFNNLTAGSLNNLLPQIAINTTVAGDIAVSASGIYISLPSGITFNTSGPQPIPVAVRTSGCAFGLVVDGTTSFNSARTSLSIKATTASNASGGAGDALNISNVYVDVAASGVNSYQNYMTITGTGVTNNTGIRFDVTKPYVAFNAVNVSRGGNTMIGPTLTVNTTTNATFSPPNGEIGIGTVSISLPPTGVIKFNASMPGITTVVLSGTGAALVVGSPTVDTTGYILSAPVTTASTAPTTTGAQNVTFSGYQLIVPQSAVKGAVTNLTITTKPTGGSVVSQETANAITVVEPIITFAGVNVTMNGLSQNSTRPITVNSTFGYPDGQIGVGFVNVTLPSDSGIKFNSTMFGIVTVVNNGGALAANQPTVSTDGLILSSRVTTASNSNASVQNLTFSGYTLDLGSNAVVGGTWNLTVTTWPANSTALTQWTNQTSTTGSITIVKPNITYAAYNYMATNVANNTINGVPIAINSTFGHPDGEIGIGTINITLSGSSSITFNTSATCLASTTATVAQTSGFGLVVGAAPTYLSATEMGFSVTGASNSTSSISSSDGNNQSVTFKGYNLSIPSGASSGVTNFLIKTTPTNGTAYTQTVTAVTVITGAADKIYPVSPDGIYPNPTSIVVGTTATFNWTVLNGTIPFGNQQINFATNGTSSWLGAQTAVSTAAGGNVSVTFTAPTIISAPAQGAAGYNITATVNGVPTVVNVTNINVINGTATKLKMFTDVTRTSPTGFANITVWAQDQYGNNQTGNVSVVRLTATESDVTIVANDQPLVAGTYMFQIKKATAGTAHLQVQNVSLNMLTAASGEQLFTGDAASNTMTPTTASLVANGKEANVSVQLINTDGTTPQGQTITFISSNTTRATVTALVNPTNSAGQATAYIRSNTAGITGTVTVFANITNASGTVLSSNCVVTLTTAYSVDSVGVFRSGSFYPRGANAYAYGLEGDTPIAGDWLGSGIDTGGVFRNGSFYPYGTTAYSYGIRGDQPFSVNWTGSIASETGVFRDGMFYIRDSTTGGTLDYFAYGIAGDLPIAGDWNGDRVDEVGVFRNGAFYLRAHDGSTYAQIAYGLAGDKPVAGDWNGDGMTEVGVFRDGSFYLRGPTGTTYDQFAYGLTGDLPIAGKWT